MLLSRLIRNLFCKAKPSKAFASREHKAMLRRFYQQLKRHHDTFPNIQIITMEDEHVCPACKTEHNRIYHYRKAPALPLKKCTCAMGCRCMPVCLP